MGVYAKVEGTMSAALKAAPKIAASDWQPPKSALVADQNAELKRFALGDFDVALGILKRRMDQSGIYGSNVRGQRRSANPDQRRAATPRNKKSSKLAKL